MNRRTIVIGVGALIVLCLCFVVIGVALAGTSVLGVLGLTQPVTDTGDKFMQSLKVADYDSAYALMAPALQRKLGNVQDLRKMVESGRVQPTQWTFTTRKMNGNDGHLEGSVTMLSGQGTVSLDLIKSGNDWQIVAFNLTTPKQVPACQIGLAIFPNSKTFFGRQVLKFLSDSCEL